MRTEFRLYCYDENGCALRVEGPYPSLDVAAFTTGIPTAEWRPTGGGSWITGDRPHRYVISEHREAEPETDRIEGRATPQCTNLSVPSGTMERTQPEEP